MTWKARNFLHRLNLWETITYNHRELEVGTLEIFANGLEKSQCLSSISLADGIVSLFLRLGPTRSTFYLPNINGANLAPGILRISSLSPRLNQYDWYTLIWLTPLCSTSRQPSSHYVLQNVMMLRGLLPRSTLQVRPSVDFALWSYLIRLFFILISASFRRHLHLLGCTCIYTSLAYGSLNHRYTAHNISTQWPAKVSPRIRTFPTRSYKES